MDESAGGDEWVTAEAVAEVMGDLVGVDEVDVAASSSALGTGLSSGDSRGGWRKIKVEGGLILEVSKGKVRKVEQFMDEGPSGAGNTVGKIDMVDREILEMLRSGKWGV